MHISVIIEVLSKPRCFRSSKTFKLRSGSIFMKTHLSGTDFQNTKDIVKLDEDFNRIWVSV